MAKITIHADYGGSPLKAFIKDYNIAFAEGNADFIIASASESIVWKMTGEKEMKGKEAFAKEINIMKDYVADELTINSIIVEGNLASADGSMKMGESEYAFSDVYEFEDSDEIRIIELRSFGIKLK